MEGAPDPFPSLSRNNEPSVQPVVPNGSSALDTDSSVAFPSLAPSAPAKASVSQPGWNNAPRIKPTAVKSTGVSDSFDLSVVDLSHAGRDNKPGTLADALKTIMLRFRVKVEASTQRKSGRTTFFIKGESEREVEKAKRQLIVNLSPRVRFCSISIFFLKRNSRIYYCLTIRSWLRLTSLLQPSPPLLVLEV